MTWGELGGHLVAVFPGLNPTLRVDYLNRAMEAILDEREWTGLQDETVLRSTDLVEDGTVALTEGSAAVAGTGTAFTAGMVGWSFRPTDGEDDAYTIAAYTSPTQITLDRAYDGETASGLAYRIYQIQFDLPAAAKAIESMTVPGYRPMESVTLERLDALYAAGFCYGPPQAYASLANPLSIASPVINEVRIYPAPDQSYDINCIYQSAVYGFTGSNTSVGPLPWISRPALIAKAKHLIALDSQDQALYAKADRYSSEFEREMTKMHAVENSRQGPSRLKGPEAFFRHRAGWGR